MGLPLLLTEASVGQGCRKRVKHLQQTHFNRKIPLQFVPPKVRAHGLRDVHTYPLVSQGKSRSGAHSASFRVLAAEAWGFPEIELRAGNSWPSIVLDIDGETAIYRIVDAVEHGEILTPNWTVTRKAGGGTHAVWNLERPVHRGESARPSPLRALARVSEFYADALQADSGYTGVLSHNPMSRAHGPGFVTNWFHRSPYSLPQLGELIPFGWRKPTIAVTGIGRNCSMFDTLLQWAGKPENQENDVLAAAMSINEEIGRLHGKAAMDQSEVGQVARNVETYRRQWLSEGRFYSAAQTRAWARERQAKGVTSRRERWGLDKRDKAIVQAVLGGETMRQVAFDRGLSVKRVHCIVKRDAPQFRPVRGRPSN